MKQRSPLSQSRVSPSNSKRAKTLEKPHSQTILINGSTEMEKLLRSYLFHLGMWMASEQLSTKETSQTISRRMILISFASMRRRLTMQSSRKKQSSSQDITGIGISARFLLDTRESQFSQNIFRFQSRRIYLKQSILKKEELSLSNFKSFTWSLLTFLTQVKSWIDLTTELKTMTSASKITVINSAKRRPPLYVEISMFVTRKLISPGQKEMKRQQDSHLKKEQASTSLFKEAGLILSGSSTPTQSSILGGAWELEVEPKTLDGDSTTSWLTQNLSTLSKTQQSTMTLWEATIALSSCACS